MAKDKMVGVEEKFKCVEKLVTEVDIEVGKLKQIKSDFDKFKEEMILKQSEFDQTVEELNRKLLGSEKTVEELTRQNLRLKQLVGTPVIPKPVAQFQDDINLPQSFWMNQENGTNDGNTIAPQPENNGFGQGPHATELPAKEKQIEIINLDDEPETVPLSRNVARKRKRSTAESEVYIADDSAVDMLKAFKEYEQLCMVAVCVLYRYQLSSLKSDPEGSGGGLHHFRAMGGCALAEYLINGDPELKVKKSVLEVKQQCPDFVDLCQRLATDYYEKIFSIYRSGVDPLFNPDNFIDIIM